MSIDHDQLKSLVGKHVFVMTRQGQVLDGTLQKIEGDKIYLRFSKKTVNTSAFSPFFNPFFNPVAPLVLFDLLAIAETPFFFGAPFFI